MSSPAYDLSVFKSRRRTLTNFINYLNRGAQGIDIVALGIDFVAVRAWAQSVCRLE